MFSGARFSYPPLYDGILDDVDHLRISNGSSGYTLTYAQF
jgi:hypothetical protein